MSHEIRWKLENLIEKSSCWPGEAREYGQDRETGETVSFGDLLRELRRVTKERDDYKAMAVQEWGIGVRYKRAWESSQAKLRQMAAKLESRRGDRPMSPLAASILGDLNELHDHLKGGGTLEEFTPPTSAPPP